MTSRELVIRALSHEPVNRVPRDIWIDPQVAAERPDDVAEIGLRFPNDVESPKVRYPAGEHSSGEPAPGKRFTDAWGCTWRMPTQGQENECLDRPLSDLRNVNKYQPPLEILRGFRLSKINRLSEQTSRFLVAPTQTCPFDRLQMLRGPELARKDLASGSKGIRALLGIIHEFCLAEMELWAHSLVDGVVLSDRWGSHSGLVVERGIWRELFRPLYREYCKILQAKDKFVFFKTSGNVTDIFGDLIRIGFDSVHVSFDLMNLHRLARRYRGKVTFWAGIQQPSALVTGSVQDVREAVLSVRRALDFGSGGLIAQCSWHPDVSIEKIIAFCEQWVVPLPVHA
jgi:uroporphyrinogen decarboxylase